MNSLEIRVVVGMKLKKIIKAFILIIAMFSAISCSRDITDVDIITLELYGEDIVVVNYGSSYIDEGAVAYENENDVSLLIKVNSNLDVNILGTYGIEYTYKDQSVFRTVTVQDTQPPKINLLGKPVVFIPTDEPYIDDSCNSFDNYDGDLSDIVKIESTVDVTKQGEYSVTYSVTDSSGNISSMRRDVIVVKSPLSADLKDFSLDGLFEDTILQEIKLTDKELKKYLDETYFIGDSRNCYFLWKGCVDRHHVWGAKSLDPLNIDRLKIKWFLTGEEVTAAKMIEKYQPKRVILTLGVDSVGATKPDIIVQHYKNFLLKVMEVSPNTHIIVHNIMPVDGYMDTTDKRPWAPDNKKINDANYFIVEMCSELGVKFLYTAPLLKDENGLGKGEYFIKDRIHLTNTAQWIVYDYIIKHPFIESDSAS
jgi:hypothetical protein